MLGLLYLTICLVAGISVVSFLNPKLFSKDMYSFGKKRILVSPVLLWMPVSFLTGIVLLTWCVYIVGRLLISTERPLAYANGIVMTAAVVLAVFLFFLNKRRNWHCRCVITEKKNTMWEVIFFLVMTVFASYFMIRSFHIKDGVICVGSPIAGDFAVHLGMIRSFSWGGNLLTAYNLYGGQDIKYHFMFEFLAGNLEFLGLPLDLALNIPSILSMVFMYMLVYVLTVKISGKNLAGYLAVIFVNLRSSESFFHYVAETPKKENLLQKLQNNSAYIGYTANESWGIWGWNVYINQRHLAIAIAVCLMVIILMMPSLYGMFQKLRRLGKTAEGKNKVGVMLKACFFEMDGWKVSNVKMAVFLGILAGGIAFWNGAALISLLTVLFFMAALSKNRLDYVIVAAIAGGLSMLQSHTFIDGKAVSPEYFLGYILEAKTVWGILYFLIHLLGMLVILLGAAFMHYKGVRRYLILVFFAPAVITFTVKMTNDVNVNHKYLFISCILLNTIAATLVGDMIRKKDWIRNVCAALIVVMMVNTGVYDLYVVNKLTREEIAVKLDENAPLTQWIGENATSYDVFLTPEYGLNRVTVAGAMLYQGYGYVCWSAGYDVDYRNQKIREMYGATSRETLTQLIDQEGIRYIIVDQSVRTNPNYIVDEALIASTYENVYQEGEGETLLNIYDTAQMIE